MILKGTDSNLNGIGARVDIFGEWGKQMREVRSGQGFSHMSSLTAHFGIGTSTTIDKITITWPSGTVDEIINPDINTLIEIENLLTNLSAERANVGANLSRLEKELNNLSGKITNGEMALSRIEDADIAKESSRFASTQVRMQASIAILAQGQQLNVGIPDLLRGVNIGG